MIVAPTVLISPNFPLLAGFTKRLNSGQYVVLIVSVKTSLLSFAIAKSYSASETQSTCFPTSMAYF